MRAKTAIKFGCETDLISRIRWNFRRLQQQGRPRVLYNGYEVISRVAWRVTINQTSRGNELIVTNLVAEDSGVYSCHDVMNFSRKVDFYLFVKGTTFYQILFNRGVEFKQTKSVARRSRIRQTSLPVQPPGELGETSSLIWPFASLCENMTSSTNLK